MFARGHRQAAMCSGLLAVASTAQQLGERCQGSALGTCQALCPWGTSTGREELLLGLTCHHAEMGFGPSPMFCEEKRSCFCLFLACFTPSELSVQLPLPCLI